MAPGGSEGKEEPSEAAGTEGIRIPRGVVMPGDACDNSSCNISCQGLCSDDRGPADPEGAPPPPCQLVCMGHQAEGEMGKVELGSEFLSFQ